MDVQPVAGRRRELASRRRATPLAVLAGALAVLAAALLVALLVAALAWRAEGGRWFVVSSPSMGTAAPVGSLLLTRPVSVEQVRRDDLVTFHSPTSRAVYTHRVVRATEDGLVTRGDLNPVDDAWRLQQDDLVGSVEHTVPGVGWALQALPPLTACLTVVLVLTTWLPRRARASARTLGTSLSLSTVSVLVHPWVGLQRLGVAPDPDGSGVVLRVVSTGLLPVRVHAVGTEGSQRLLTGEVAELHARNVDRHGTYVVLSQLSLGWWGWVVVVAVCAVPLLWCLLVGLPAPAHRLEPPLPTLPALRRAPAAEPDRVPA